MNDTILNLKMTIEEAQLLRLALTICMTGPPGSTGLNDRDRRDMREIRSVIGALLNDPVE